MRPLIGIPLCLDDRERWKPKRSYLYIDSAYARAVEEAGGMPLLLPVQEEVPDLIARIDGLLIPGGDDFPPPAAYPEGVHFEPVPEDQLAFDRALVDAARESATPVLGICYGMQLLALQAGAALHYHLPHDLPGADAHQLSDAQGPDDPPGRHIVSVQPETHLARLLGAGDHSVNSRHHQALATAGNGMVVSARARDGVIEAVESEGEAFCLGVQWHPETLETKAHACLFDALIAASRAPGA